MLICLFSAFRSLGLDVFPCKGKKFCRSALAEYDCIVPIVVSKDRNKHHLGASSVLMSVGYNRVYYGLL